MGIAGQVDQNVAKNPIHQPWRTIIPARTRNLAERNFELVEIVGATLVDTRRLAGRTDEHAGKEIRQRRMIEPIAEHAAQHVGAAQKRAVVGRRTAERAMISAAGPAMASVEHEL